MIRDRIRKISLLIIPVFSLFLIQTVVGRASGNPITNLIATPEAFSPNGDGVKDRVSFKFNLSEKTTVSFNIEKDGVIVKKILDLKKLSPGLQILNWNGFSSPKTRVQDGLYRGVAIAYTNKEQYRAEVSLKVDTEKPKILTADVSPASFWPDGDGFRDSTRLLVSCNEKSSYIFTVLGSSGVTLFTEASSELSSEGVFWWKGSSGESTVSYGRYTLQLRATDEAGNSAKKSLSVLVSPFSDINSLPESYKGAIVGLVEKGIVKVRSNGLFSGDSVGLFHPLRSSTRGDLVVALAKCFGYEGEKTNPEILFKDISSESFLYRYANLAVKKGFVAKFADETFKPKATASDALVLSSLVKALGLKREAQTIMKQDPKMSWYAGFCVIAHHLGLKYKKSRTWPNQAFSRRELAWSIYKVGNVEKWRMDRVKQTFSSKLYREFRFSVLQNEIVSFAKKWIGYPYVWGGDSPREGGFDCSGLMYYDYLVNFGYSIKRTAAAGAADDRYPRITFDELQPADLIYFWDGDRSRISHTGMYLGRNFFIHSSGSRSGVSIDSLDPNLGPYWRSQFAWGRRVIPVLKVSKLEALPRVISPNGDGFADRFFIEYRITKKALATLLISDDKGLVVRSLSALQESGKNQISWGGEKMNGKGAGSGRYKYRLGLVDEEGNRKVFEGFVWIDLERPHLEELSLNPVKFNPRNVKTKWTTISYDLSERAYVQLKMLNSTGKTVKVLTNWDLKAVGRNISSWDGTDVSGKYVSSGTYTVYFGLRDIVQNKGSAKGSVIVE